MKWDDWAAVPNNPVQRDTIKHATRSHRPGGHLSKPHESHTQVAMAQLPNGKQFKLDGHSRCWLVESELLPPIKKVTVTVYEVKDKLAAIDLYYHFDNSAATETKRDKLHGAFRRYGLEPRHGLLLNNCGLMSAIEYTVFPKKWADLRNVGFSAMVKPWVPTVKILDSGDFPNHHIFRSAFMLMALMVIRRDGEAAMEFIQGYADDTGRKSAVTCDGIFAARDLYSLMLIEAKNRGGRRVHAMYTPYFLKCYDNWHEGKKMKRIVRVEGKKLPTDILTVRGWWDANLGELDQQQIRGPIETDDTKQGSLPL